MPTSDRVRRHARGWPCARTRPGSSRADAGFHLSKASQVIVPTAPEDGLLIFDINTEQELRRKIRESAWVKIMDYAPVIMKVTDAGNGVSNWNIKVFERQGGKRYRPHEENPHED
jgi:hypothetical protein